MRRLRQNATPSPPAITPADSGEATRARARPAAAVRYRVREGHVLAVDDTTSERMRGVRQSGTEPELCVRRSLAALGQRYRLLNRDLEGSPDLANRRQRWVVFVHGCFWHRHGCKATTTPTRNREFWEAKFQRNVERDRRVTEALRGRGYVVVVIWECETKRGVMAVRDALIDSLPPRPGPGSARRQTLQRNPRSDR